LALNALVDISQILASQRKTCINVVAFGEASADGSLIHGRNTDFPCTDVLPRTATVFHCRPDKGYPYLSVAWAGFSGALTAMNSAGITVTEVGYIFDELQLEATPIALIVRRIAQYATTIDDAVAIVAESRRTAGFNLTVTDWKVPEARAIEFTATRYGVRSADRGLLVVSDNRLSRAMTKRQLAEPCGVARYIRALSLAEAERGSIDLDAMKRILRDRFDVLSYRMSDTVNCVCSRNTIQSVVFQPEQQTAWVSHNTIPAPTGEYVAYKLPA
jgi:isopenicillin-N N-acyltransferase-like protein